MCLPCRRTNETLTLNVVSTHRVSTSRQYCFGWCKNKIVESFRYRIPGQQTKSKMFVQRLRHRTEQTFVFAYNQRFHFENYLFGWESVRYGTFVGSVECDHRHYAKRIEIVSFQSSNCFFNRPKRVLLRGIILF